jgi:hypothetical protein
VAHAYTPGLRVSSHATVRKQRRLPLKGTVAVGVGDRVKRDQVAARTELPGNVTSVNLVNKLGVTPVELPNFMLCQVGDPVQVGDPIAETRPFIKWFKTTVQSPVAGTLESVSTVTGQVLLRQPPEPVEVLAFIDGKVVEVIEEEGVVIETAGAYIQGIFGVGGETWGRLRMVADDPGDGVTADRIPDDCAGEILVGGSLIEYGAIEKARAVGAAGLIGGGIRDQDLRTLLGYDLGVAITGTEQIGLTLIISEGFGEIAMARKTFDILKECAGREASISGATQIRAGVMRPEIIVPTNPAGEHTEATTAGDEGLKIGRQLRAIRAPYFGRIGHVSDLPSELQKVESGAQVRVLKVEFEDGVRAIVPRANVELIEE